MDNNTPDQFSHLTNRELLEILHRPEDHRPEAVAAAERLLRERDIPMAEREEVAQRLRSVEEGVAAKWWNIFFLMITLEYAWFYYESVEDCLKYIGNVVDCMRNVVGLSDNKPVGFFRCAAAYWQTGMSLTYANLAYIPVLLFLLYVRRKWGWILLTADTFIALICRTAQLYFYFSYPFLHFSMSGFLFLEFFRIAILLFLYRKDIRALFGIDRSTALRTIGVSTLLALGFFGLLVVLSSP